MKQKFNIIDSTCVPLPLENVDTDQIIPARFLKATDKAGFGDNLRVLEWILKRCFDEVGADETVIGYEPKPEDINLDGSGVTIETLRELLTLDAESWRENCAGIREYFEQFGDKLPHELREELEALEKAFAE